MGGVNGYAQGITNERGELVGIVPDWELQRLRHLWQSMKDRCSKPTNIAYKYYGKRGIRVCERWRSFARFIEDMGPRPSGAHSLDRINIMKLDSPDSAILSAVIFNALIIVALIPLSLRGVKFRAASAIDMLRRNLLIYGLGGLIAPFIGIKLIDLLITSLGVK